MNVCVCVCVCVCMFEDDVEQLVGESDRKRE